VYTAKAASDAKRYVYAFIAFFGKLLTCLFPLLPRAALFAFQLSMLYTISRVQSRHVAARLRDRQYQPPASMADAKGGDIYASIISMLIFAAGAHHTAFIKAAFTAYKKNGAEVLCEDLQNGTVG